MEVRVSDDGEERQLLRLRGWGRGGGIHGRAVSRRRPVSPPAGKGADRNGIEAMRRAAALYLTSRECVARDVAHFLLPPAKGGGGDLMLFTRRGVFMIGFAPAKGRPSPGLARMAWRIRELGQNCRIIHAETPAHAVELLARLVDGAAGAVGAGKET